MAYITQETLEAFVGELRTAVAAEITRLDGDVLAAVGAATEDGPWKAAVESMLLAHASKAEAGMDGLRQLHAEAKAEVDSLKKRLKATEEGGGREKREHWERRKIGNQ